MARIKQRKAITRIFHIQDSNGQRVEGFKAVYKVMIDFYKDLLGKTEFQRSNVNPGVIAVGATLTLEQQVHLCRPFSNNEIKQMIFSIPNHKSPRPDGYNSGFFTKHAGEKFVY